MPSFTYTYPTSPNQYKLTLNITQGTGNVNTNSTPVSWSLQLTTPSNNYFEAKSTYSAVINGVTVVSKNEQVNTSAVSTTYTLASGTTTVAHNANGTKTIAVSASFRTNDQSSYWRVPPLSVSGNVTLTTIPRASNPTVNYSSRNLGSTVRITTNRASTSFTHTVQYAVGSLGWTNISTGVGAYVDWTLPNTIASYIASNKTSGAVSIRVITYSGSTQIGSATTSLTAVIPNTETFQPNASISSVTEGASLPSGITNYVQGYSRFKVTSSGSGKYGATVSAYRVTIDGVHYNGNSITSNVLSSSGSRSIALRVTDSRGFSTTVSTSRSVTAYSPPKLTSVSATRSPNDQGTNLSASINFTISPISNKNSKQYRIRYRASGGSWVSPSLVDSTAYYTRNTTHSATGVLDINSSYEVEFYIKDSFTSVTQTLNVGTTFTLMDFHKDGRAMAIGKVSEDNYFEVGMPTTIFTDEANLLTLKRSHPYESNVNVNLVFENDFQTRYMTFKATGRPAWGDDPNVNAKGYNFWTEENSDVITESGSNPNGTYIRFSDGTQICWWEATVTNQAINSAYGTLFTGTRVWTFPASFISTPSVPSPQLKWGTSGSWGAVSSATNSSAVLRGLDIVSRATGTACYISAIAIGRWK